MPTSPRNATEASAFQPGISPGAWTIPAGSSATTATTVVPSATTCGRASREVPAREEAAGRVADGHPDDRERAEDLRLGLRADEQRDADEAHRDPDEPAARHALLVEERRTRARRRRSARTPG